MGKRSRANREAPSPAPTPKSNDILALLSRIKPGWAVLCVLVGGAFTFIVQSDDFFKNLQSLPASADRTWGKYQSWVYEDEQWQGKWSSSVEGYVDFESMGLAGDAKLDIDATRGEFHGFITTRRVCQELPLLGALMVNGSVSGDSANVRVWEYVGGREIPFARLKFKRKDGVIEVIPVEDELNLFQQPIRVAIDPSALGSEQTDILDFCEAERAALMKKIRPPGLPSKRG